MYVDVNISVLFDCVAVRTDIWLNQTSNQATASQMFPVFAMLSIENAGLLSQG